jgi:hypothetical protein
MIISIPGDTIPRKLIRNKTPSFNNKKTPSPPEINQISAADGISPMTG